MDRRGKRKNRKLNEGTRTPRLGYYIIVTDAEETEKNYFNGIKEAIPKHLKDQLVIKIFPGQRNLSKIVDYTLELISKDPQYRKPWIIIDRDKVNKFDDLIKKAESHNINVGWSNPCIEVWFYSYFNKVPNFSESVVCCEKFKELFKRKTGQEYKKNDKDITKKLRKYGDEKAAIKRSYDKFKTLALSNSKPSKMYSRNTIFKLVEEVTTIIDKNE